MKNKLKYLTAAILALSICAGCAVHASAEEGADDATEIISVINSTEAEDSDATMKEAEYESADGNSTEGEEDEKSDTGEGETFFSRIYKELAGYASEILCALTLAGSLTLAVAYKKGLLPLLEGSLVTIGNAIAKIKESTKESADATSAVSKSIENELSDARAVIATLTEKIEGLRGAVENELAARSHDRADRDRLTTVVNEQIEMLYDIFMTAALPQYQKDAVGERIAKMKEALRENGCEN